MSQKPASGSSVPTAIGQSVRSFGSVWTLAAIVISAAISLGIHKAPSDLASTVFTADATLVALVVPAAALEPTATSASAAGELRDLADQVVEAVKPLVRGFVFLLLSLGLAIGALFHPNHHIWTGAGWWKVNLEDMLLGGSLGFDVVGIVLFLPFVWLLLDQELAARTRDVIKDYADLLAKAAPTSTTTATTAAERKEQGGPPKEKQDTG
jgi:hypothetical protein